MKERNEILQNLIDILEKTYSVYICIRDISGISNFIPQMRLKLKNKNHSCPFCRAINKMSKYCAEKCVENDYEIISKLDDHNVGYSGFCYSGIYKVVQPVYYKNELICMIFIEGFAIKEEYKNSLEKISDICKKTGCERKILIEEFNKLPCLPAAKINEIENVADILFRLIVLILENNENLLLQYKKSDSNMLINAVTEYVISNFRNEISLKSIAKVFHVNYNYLSKTFKEETGLNFIDYVTKLRIEEAKKMILFSNKTITEITFELGYNDTAYFSKVFKRYTGYSPSHFKNHYGLFQEP